MHYKSTRYSVCTKSTIKKTTLKRKSTHNVRLQNRSIFWNQFQFLKSITSPKVNSEEVDSCNKSTYRTILYPKVTQCLSYPYLTLTSVAKGDHVDWSRVGIEELLFWKSFQCSWKCIKSYKEEWKRRSDYRASSKLTAWENCFLNETYFL